MRKVLRAESQNRKAFFLDPKDVYFENVIQTGVFVDKSKLLEYTNRGIGTPDKFICVARPRRFGKTLAASMLANYYSCRADSSQLFQNLAIASSPTYLQHLNQYHVIQIDVLQASLDFRDLLGKRPYASEDCREQLPDYAARSLLHYIKFVIEKELREAFPACSDWKGSLGIILQEIYRNSPAHPRFVLIIDEWDYLFRRNAPAAELQAYMDFLCSLCKGATRQAHLALVYLTGIYPIRVCCAGPLAGVFSEYSMVEPLRMGECMGFTEAEVRKLCLEHDMPFDEMRDWCDGYRFRNTGPVYNPLSVVRVIQERTFTGYWTETESYESLLAYLNRDGKGLKQTIALLMEGETVQADTRTFSLLADAPLTRDAVLTQLVHLGYLLCLADPAGRAALSIPNQEILAAFAAATETAEWAAVLDSLMDSELLLPETWRGNAAAVAERTAAIHRDYAGAADYNDVNTLGTVLRLTYFTARNQYQILQEENTGLGRAVLLFRPKAGSAAVPMVIELKWNKTAQSAIEQIKAGQYCRSFSGCPKVLLVGIRYDPDSGAHACTMETWVKPEQTATP